MSYQKGENPRTVLLSVEGCIVTTLHEFVMTPVSDVEYVIWDGGVFKFSRYDEGDDCVQEFVREPSTSVTIEGGSTIYNAPGTQG